MSRIEPHPNGFVAAVESSGLKLSKAGEANQLDTEPAKFKSKLLKQFDREDREEFTENFIEGVFEYTTNHRCFRACLMPTVFTNSDELSLLAPRESVFKYLLGIDPLQEKMAEVLITKLIDATSQVGRVDYVTAKSILNQFRWLDQIANPGDLLEKLVELIDITPLNVQQEIIGALPEIFIDVDHLGLLEKLIALAQGSNELFVPVIECLGNINIPAPENSRIGDLILNRLDSIELDSLAVAVHFLLLSGSEESLFPTLTAIRAKIDLDQLRRVERAGRSAKRNKQTNPTSYETLLLDKVEKILVASGPVKAAWVKLFEGLRGGDKVYSLDILVLVILHSMNDTKRKVEQLFKAKVLCGLLKKEFLIQTTRKFLPLMGREVSAAIDGAIFHAADLYHRQEVVGALITHIGSGNAWEIDHALDALDTITREDPPGMLHFTIFVKGILDYLDRLTLDQVARLFVVYTTLALEEGADPGEGGLKNDLHMIIRKQLTHPLEKYKRIGITSSLAMIKQLSSRYAATIDDPRFSCGSSSGTSRHPILDQAISMLQLLQAACHKSTPSLPVAYNGLSQMILRGELHADLVHWIFDHIIVLFADLFVVEANGEALAPVHPPSWPESFQLEVWDDLNEGSAAVAINILPAVVRHFYNDRKSYHSSFICALFNLYQASERFINGSLEELDALLGCGIVMFDKDLLRSSHCTKGDMQECLIMAMVVAQNWYRELVNAFHLDTDASLAQKVKARVGHMVRIEELLDALVVYRHHVADLDPFEGSHKKPQHSAGLSRSELRASLRKLAPTTYTLIQKRDGPDPESASLLELEDAQVLFLIENLKARLEEPACRTFMREASTISGLCGLFKLLEESCRQCAAVEEVSSQGAALALECLLKVVESYPLASEAGVEQSDSGSMLLDAYHSVSGASSLLLDLPTSILLEKVLSGIAKRIPRDEGLIAKLRLLIQSLMSRHWGAALKKDTLAYLINEEFAYAADPKLVLETYLTHLLGPFVEDQDADFSSSYPSFSRPQFPTFYSVLSKQLLAIASAQRPSSPEALGSIKALASQWHLLVKTATVMNSDRSVLLTVLRTGRSFVDTFSKTMLPTMDAYLPSNRGIVLSIFKSVQQGTRKLQNICNVTKTPPCRSKMEAFVLQVKQMFKEHNILDAYTVGDLKHRDISGTVLPSQIPANEILSEECASSEGEPVASQAPKALKRTRYRGPIFNRAKKLRNEAPSPTEEPDELSHVPLLSD
ncbi:hypothetical protein L0F63_002729 [Massospora cicadina]|nr:hypothetical protein L0F63_002729 [Massospora cicadina]